MRMPAREILAWLLVLILPGMLWTAYLFIARTSRAYSLFTDSLALGAAVLIGVGGVLMLTHTFRVRLRLLACLAYVLFVGAGMYLGMEVTACSMGDCY